MRRFFHEHNCRSEERIQERITSIAATVPAIRDQAVVEAESLRARSLVALLARSYRTSMAASFCRTAESTFYR